MWKKLIYPQPPQLNILVIGDECIDRYITVFSKDNLEKEVPAFVFRGDYDSNIEDKAGMAGNVTKNIRTLFRGTSSARVLQMSTLAGEQCIKTRYMLGYGGESEYVLRIDDDREAKTKFDMSRMPSVHTIDAIVISDYCKGFLTDTNIREICKLAKDNSIPLFIDTKRIDLSIITYGYVKINKHEAERLVSLPKTHLITTLGSMGAAYGPALYPGYKTDVKDSCGAGDSFLAGLVVEYLRTKNIHSAIEFANAHAAVSVGHYGCYAGTYEETKQAIKRYDTTTR